MYKTPYNAFLADKESLTKVNNISDKDIDNIILSRDIYKIRKGIDILNSKNINFVHIGSEEYPKRLMNIYDPPYALYVRGSLPYDSIPTVAIIGARVCSTYGSTIARRISKELAGYGIQIISGMAKGIDGAAHSGALDVGGATYGLLGCGVDICYPACNIDIFARAEKSGGLISEYPIGSPAMAYRFPQRNRLISGLADVIIVVEAKEKSGSLITVDAALEQGKDIYAVPGRLDDELSRGCNALINNGAGIYTSVKDILEHFGIEYKDCISDNEFLLKNKNLLEKDLQVLYSCFDLLPKSLEEICSITGLSISKALQMITSLQMMDLVAEPFKNHYIKKI